MARDKKASKVQSEGADHSAAAALPATDAAKESDAREGPVLMVILKRLRAANKKLKRCEEIEASRAAGKVLNADQARNRRRTPLCLHVCVASSLPKAMPLMAACSTSCIRS